MPVIFQVHITSLFIIFVLTLGHENASDDFGIYEFITFPDLTNGSKVCDFYIINRLFLFYFSRCTKNLYQNPSVGLLLLLLMDVCMTPYSWLLFTQYLLFLACVTSSVLCNQHSEVRNRQALETAISIQPPYITRILKEY